MKPNTIQEYLNQPNELERIYREDTNQFKLLFNELYPNIEHTEIVQVWNERLNYKEDKLNGINRKDFINAIVISLLSGVLSRILLYFVQQEVISFINLVIVIMSFLGIYFIVRNKLSKINIILLISVLGMIVLSINLLPNNFSDTTILAYLHLPIFMWIWIGSSYTSNKYNDNPMSLAFLRYNGEFIVLYTIMAISGIILTGITMQLFYMINLDISEFYFTNIVLFGIASLSILATYLIDIKLNIVRNIAPLIAKLFGPLVLITLILFIVSIIITGQNPFIDRDFLLMFNIVLVIVLAISIFSIIENSNSKITDTINCALITIALLIDLFALSAIIFRLNSYGLTPNRFAVLGINIIIGIHLGLILVSYYGYFKKNKPLQTIHNSITSYLPIYGIWSVIVILIFPLIF